MDDPVKTQQQLREILTPREWQLYIRYAGLYDSRNWGAEELAKEYWLDVDTVNKNIKSASEKVAKFADEQFKKQPA